jgi:hypothetical protein
MKNATIEPDIRLKAASILLDRNLGKAPQIVALTTDKAFEEIFSDIYSGTRQSSREQRDYIDAEVVDSAQSDAIDSSDRRPESSDGFDASHADDSKKQLALTDSAGTERNGVDARLFERNDAILAQTIEIKPFEYDLSNHSDEIKKATKTRYASRALGVDLTTPDYPLVREILPDGNIRWVDPKGQAGQGPKKQAEKRRKTYTLSDFD